MTEAEHGPVLITGLDHSGKTPLRVALDAHSALALIRRAYFWTYFDGRFGSLDRSANLARCMDALSRHGPIAALGIDLDAVAVRLAGGTMSYDRLFALIGEEHARRQGRRRWGVQESLLERHADRLLAADASTRIVHVVRDPRTWYAAVRASGGRRGGTGVATAVWEHSARLALRNAERHPDRCQVVRYERLATDPAEVLREVCGFVGEDATPEVLAAANRLAPDRRATAVLPESARAFIEDEARELMGALGYHGEAGLQGGERLRYRVMDRPFGRAAGAAWEAAERVGPRLRPLIRGRAMRKVRLRDT